jgi:DNA-binding NarL/FixJ family response regulator
VGAKQHKILLVDDHPIVRRGFREVIARETDLDISGEAGSASEAFEQIECNRPDLIIVDISLNDIGGLELIKQIQAQYDNIRILVASMHDDCVYAERALHAGALGYINKTQATDHLIGAVRQVLSGKIYLSEETTTRILERTRTGSGNEKSPIESMSDREIEVFQLFGQGLTTKEVAVRLQRSVKTIESHRENIKTKLGIESSAQLVHRATLWVNEINTRNPMHGIS